jgi:hypothetical protein
MKIEEAVTFIKATREEAITQAYEMGGGEVHALHISKGFSTPANKPVGYFVVPTKRKWEKLAEEEITGLTCECIDDGTFNMECAHEFAKSINNMLKEKNT